MNVKEIREIREKAIDAINQELNRILSENDLVTLANIISDTCDTVVSYKLEDLLKAMPPLYMLEVVQNENSINSTKAANGKLFFISDDERDCSLQTIEDFEDMNGLADMILEQDFDVIERWNTPKILLTVKEYYNS